MTPRHLDIETSRKLHEAGAWEGREFQAGDWVVYKDCLVGIETIPRIVIVQRVWRDDDEDNASQSNLKVYTPDISRGLWVEPANCILLPTLSDVLDELERVCFYVESKCYTSSMLTSGPLCRYRASASKDGRPYIEQGELIYCDGEGPDPLTAAASCLLAVLQARKEVG